MSAEQVPHPDPTDEVREQLPRWKWVAGILLGGILATWLASIIVMQTGGYHSDQVLRTGTATVGQCNNSVWFTKSCQAQVRWADGTTSSTKVFSMGRPSSTVKVADHPRVNSFGMASTANPVTLVDGFPTTAHPGLGRLAIWGSALAGAGLGLACVLVPHWVRTREIRYALQD